MEPKIKVQVLKDLAEAADAQAVVCTKVTTLPIPVVPATIQHCSACGERIWLADNSPRGIKLICYECIEPDLIAEIEKGEEVTVSMTEYSARNILRRGGKL